MKKVIFGLTVMFIGFGFLTGLPLIGAQGYTTQATTLTKHNANSGDEITPEQAAILNQELEAMKVTLLQLQAQYAAQNPSTSPAPVATPAPETITLTSADVVLIQKVLEAMSVALIQIRTSLSNNNLSPMAMDEISATLVSMGSTLTSIDSAVLSAKIESTPTKVALSHTQAPAKSKSVSSAVNENSASLESIAPAEQNAQEVAQVGSSLSLRKYRTPLIIAGLIALIVLLWYWLSKPGEKIAKPKQTTALQQVNQNESTL